MGLFMDGDRSPLAFPLFPGNANEQTSLKPREKNVLGEFGCQKFIYCSDAGLGSEAIREYNHMVVQAYIVTQSIKKLKKEEKEWALSPQGFKRVFDDKPVDIMKLPKDDKGLYYKDEPYATPQKTAAALDYNLFPKAYPVSEIHPKQTGGTDTKKCWIQERHKKRTERTQMPRNVSLERRPLQKRGSYGYPRISGGG